MFRRIFAFALLLAPLSAVTVGAEPATGTVTVRAEETGLGAGSLATCLASANLGSEILAGSASPTDDARQDRIWANAFAAPGSPSQALLNASFNPQGWYVITETISVGKLRGGKQELLAFRPNVVPEPGTCLPMATGLVGIVLITRRRRA